MRAGCAVSGVSSLVGVEMVLRFVVAFSSHFCSIAFFLFFVFVPVGVRLTACLRNRFHRDHLFFVCANDAHGDWTGFLRNQGRIFRVASLVQFDASCAWMLITAAVRLFRGLRTGGRGQKLLPTVVAAKVERFSIAFSVESRGFVHGHSADGIFRHGFRFIHGRVSFLVVVIAL